MEALIYLNEPTSPRITYIFTTILNAIGINHFEFTADKKFYQNSERPKFNYSNFRWFEDEIWIKPVSLLFEEDIREQDLICFKWNGLKAFYKTDGDFPFDIFAAAFYLVSRYEEYLPHKLDFYGRYAHKNSIAYRKGFLNQPLVNLWTDEFRKIFFKKYPEASLQPPCFKFTPTYDIDIAWSYKHKGFIRNAGGLLKSVFKSQWAAVKERLAVLAGKQEDPFDSFYWLHQLHLEYSLTPIYFFLLAEKNKGYDKNILPNKKALQRLIRDLPLAYGCGIHPSWQSGDNEEILKKEILLLQSLTNNAVTKSRQHYIRMTLPDTYRKLINAGIKEDYSMGYGSINGFRASYCLPFKWYDLKKEQQTNLTIFPFCYMDANAYYEQHYSAREALEEMEYYYKITKQVNGHFITIWHNHFLGTDRMFKGWKEYRTVIDRIKKG